MITAQTVRRDPRLAGRLVRYHAWPHLRQQTVAEHSWNVARILMSIFPDSPRLIAYAVTHDIGEMGTGDMPGDVKCRQPEVKRLLDEEEESTVSVMEAVWQIHIPYLSESEYLILKIADALEMWEWALEELLSGNQFARPVVELTTEWWMSRLQGVSKPVQDRVMQYVSTRNREWGV